MRLPTHLSLCVLAASFVMVAPPATRASPLEAYPEYDVDSPDEDHARWAKRFSANNDDAAATIAFRSAVRFHPNSVANRQNLAVSLMREGELESSRRAFGDAFALARRLNKPLRRLRANLQILRREWQNDFNEFMDPIEGEYEKKSESLNMLFKQRQDHVPLYLLAERKHMDGDTAQRGVEGGLERKLSEEEYASAPPTQIRLDAGDEGMVTQDDLLSWVGSPDFQDVYWEQWPVVIRAPGAVQDLTSLDYLCRDGPYGYAHDKTTFPHRNVNYLKETFGNKDPIKAGTPQGCKELKNALSRNYTLQLLGTHYWIPSIANMSYWLSMETARPVSVNLYVTPQGQSTSLVPHSDFQCSLMMQLEGRKRWRLWKMPDAWLPVRYRHIHGRDSGDIIEAEWLGKPYMDVVLEPGDVLYVPRGCMHLTSTALGDNVTSDNSGAASVHLTVGMEAMWDLGVSLTWEAFLGAGEFFRHEHVSESYFRALGNLIDNDKRFRETLPKWFLDTDVTSVDHAGSRVRAWDDELQTNSGFAENQAEKDMEKWFKDQARERLYAIVDEMIDNTPLVDRVRRLSTQTKAEHNRQLKELVDIVGKNHHQRESDRKQQGDSEESFDGKRKNDQRRKRRAGQRSKGVKGSKKGVRDRREL